MNEKIRDHVRAYNIREFDDASDEGIIETITDSKTVFKKTTGDRRWWTETFNVVEVDGLMIGFDWAETTGDENAKDKGWEFDPSSICEVVAKEVTKTVYVKA